MGEMRRDDENWMGVELGVVPKREVSQYCTDNIRLTDTEYALMLGIQAIRRIVRRSGVCCLCNIELLHAGALVTSRF